MVESSAAYRISELMGHPGSDTPRVLRAQMKSVAFLIQVLTVYRNTFPNVSCAESTDVSSLLPLLPPSKAQKSSALKDSP